MPGTTRPFCKRRFADGIRGGLAVGRVWRGGNKQQHASQYATQEMPASSLTLGQASGGGSLDVVPWTGEGPFLIAVHVGGPQNLVMVHNGQVAVGHTLRNSNPDGQGITDLEFAPHDERLLLSSSEDWTMKLWRLPDDPPRRRLVEPVLTLQGYSREVHN